jgi:hypothetical protein
VVQQIAAYKLGSRSSKYLTLNVHRGTSLVAGCYSPKTSEPAPNKIMLSTKAELSRYFEMINRRVPTRVTHFIRWLRQPSSFAARLAVAILFILGGIFSFLPVLGIWMLPLGLQLIAQDVHFLQKPLVTSLSWTEG